MVDYSKWKNIDISDDEDDTHPNIDTPSLFKWRHEARVQKMQEMEQKKQHFQKKKQELETTRKELEAKKSKGEDFSKLLEKVSLNESAIKAEEEELLKEERLAPWNVDTIGKPGFSKTVINATKPKDQKEMTDEEKTKQFQNFTRKYEKELKKFGMLRKYEDSKKFLQDHQELACEDTANYLTFWCIDLAIDDKFELMDHVAHQAIAVQFMLELAKQTDMDPRACSAAFFSKMAHVEQTEYKEAFETELRLFRLRIRKRAEQKIQEAMEEERKQRLGPGGLDPVEVFDTLPEALQNCFEAKDIPLLQKVISELPVEEATYHMKRCVDSGLWVPPEKSELEEEEAEGENEYATVVKEGEEAAPATTEAKTENA